ncbi:MAG: MerR family transcriptional regulator [Acidobacteria bacterium]|nr:MAG: MerR family transcriptional regulator [Acidobacteriota bacterium]
MPPRAQKKPKRIGYMISAVAEMYHIHPQTLRLYERENLLVPSRSEGNTRLYTQDDLERLEIILKLTRELGVNLAGVEIILNMRDRMNAMHQEMQAFMEYVRSRVEERPEELDEHFRNALVRVAPPRLIRLRAPHRE